MLCKCLLAFSVGVDDSIEMEKMGSMIFLQMNWIYFCNCFEIPAHLIFGLRHKKDQGDHTLWRTTESRGWIRERAVSSRGFGAVVRLTCRDWVCCHWKQGIREWILCARRWDMIIYWLCILRASTFLAVFFFFIYVKWGSMLLCQVWYYLYDGNSNSQDTVQCFLDFISSVSHKAWGRHWGVQQTLRAHTSSRVRIWVHVCLISESLLLTISLCGL